MTGPTRIVCGSFRRVTRQIFQLTLCAGTLALAPSTPAEALPFDFNSLADGASNGSVQTYMNSVLGCAPDCVKVTNARAERDYTGDGHVVGPNTGNVALTLGRSDGTTTHLGSLDTFIVNASGTTKIIMDFLFPIYNVSFDYEIFPDGTCANGTSGVCGSTLGGTDPNGLNWPDFKFYADGVLQFATQGVMPGDSGAPYTHSPNSGSNKTEKAPQFLGHADTMLFPNGVYQLIFEDWPAMIGIDNLRINDPMPNTPTPMPEPGTMVLLATGLGECYRRRRKARS